MLACCSGANYGNEHVNQQTSLNQRDSAHRPNANNINSRTQIIWYILERQPKYLKQQRQFSNSTWQPKGTSIFNLFVISMHRFLLRFAPCSSQVTLPRSLKFWNRCSSENLSISYQIPLQNINMFAFSDQMPTFRTSHQKCQRPRQTIPNIASKSIQNSQKSWNRCPSENLSISYQILLQKSIFLHFATKCPSGFILSATARDNGLFLF